MPMGHEDGKQLTGLMTLRNFIEGGHEVKDGKILVCVKSIGTRKKCRFNFPPLSTPTSYMLHLV